MKVSRVASTFVAFIIAVAFAVFIWPTLYRPLTIIPPTMKPSDLPPVAARQNRITGRVQWLLYPHGWVTAEQ
jgi:hypothetical protein